MMCWNKKYVCYKGKETEECCNSRVEEAVTRRTNIIVLVVAVAFLVMALTIRTANNEEFVAQFSFASTITSIILSVIAIWMSISGERNTNAIKEKVNDSVKKLTATTNMSVNLSNKLETILETQNSKYDEIRVKMEEVICNIRGMKESFDLFGDAFGEKDSCSDETDTCLDEDSLRKMVNITLKNMYATEAPEKIKIVKKAMAFIYDELENGNKKGKGVPVNDVNEYLLQYCSGEQAALILGVLLVFSRSGVFQKVRRDVFDL